MLTRASAGAIVGRVSDGSAIDPNNPGESHYRSVLHPDEVIAGFVAGQHGVVARSQLLAAGLSRHEIDDRVASGHLRREHRGVYVVGHRSKGWPGVWMAAVLSCGAGAALFRTSAAAHLGLVRARPQTIEIVCPRALRPRGTIRPHRSSLPADELTIHDSIPATTVARTLLDLAAVLDRHRLERAMNEAEIRCLTSPTSLPLLLARHPRVPGAGRLREILELETLGAGLTRSELEDRLLALLDDHGLPRPSTNVAIELPSGPIVADCLWLPSRVVLELDGERFHAPEHRRRSDLARDRELTALGYRPVRASWWDVVTEPGRLACDLRSILGLPPRQ